jgi:hypothetical protein
MDRRLRRLLVDSAPLFGLALFAVGTTVLVLDYPFPVEPPVLGVLAPVRRLWRRAGTAVSDLERRPNRLRP